MSTASFNLYQSMNHLLQGFHFFIRVWLHNYRLFAILRIIEIQKFLEEFVIGSRSYFDVSFFEM